MMRKPPQHRFICFEGVDGSGKSTLAHHLAKEMNAAYLYSPPEALLPIREKIRTFPPHIQYQYYLLGNLITNTEVDTLIDRTSVIVDRYIYSTIAFHAPLLNPLREKAMVLPKIREPDLVIYVTASWEEIERRLSTRSERKSTENILYLKRVAQEYKRIFENRTGVLKIDTTQEEPDNVIQRIMGVINGTRN